MTPSPWLYRWASVDVEEVQVPLPIPYPFGERGRGGHDRSGRTMQAQLRDTRTICGLIGCIRSQGQDRSGLVARRQQDGLNSLFGLPRVIRVPVLCLLVVLPACARPPAAIGCPSTVAGSVAPRVELRPVGAVPAASTSDDSTDRIDPVGAGRTPDAPAAALPPMTPPGAITRPPGVHRHRTSRRGRSSAGPPGSGRSGGRRLPGLPPPGVNHWRQPCPRLGPAAGATGGSAWG